jgi:hypothetical protein
MILKGSQRGSAIEMGNHLLKAENEHVEVHDLRGFMAEDVLGAMKEAEAISRGTRCRQHLFSVSFNPPEHENPSIEDFERAIESVESANGLDGQPRVIVFHEKEGRRHAHCVWSRIDADTMTARPLPFFKNKLREISKELYLEHGWRMPMGLIDSAARDPLNFSLAEWQQAKRQGSDPRALKAVLQECWAASDSASAFEQSLKERGLHLAQGDRRNFVAVDFQGEVHSLTRALGLKGKAVAARLGDGSNLTPVASVQANVAARMTGSIKRHIADARAQFEERSKAQANAKRAMVTQQRADRFALKERQRLEWQQATKTRAARMPRGLKALWWRLTGDYRKVRSANELEAGEQQKRQRAERERMIAAQLDDRRTLQWAVKTLRSEQAARLNELRRDVGRFLRISKDQFATRERAAGVGLELKLER